jgi:tetratricopeptide (TPR) repeat protein
VAPNLGDGLLVYFGLPRAHEDDARRAVHAALGIVEAMRVLSSRLERERGVRVTVRLGIHTGSVLLGDLGRGDRGEHVAVGEPPHVALQLQEIAEGDTVVISAATQRLIEGYFVCQALGSHLLPALSEPLLVYRVLGESATRGRLDAVTASFTPLVGREQEVGLLLERWEHAKDGLGQVVLLSGEAGIGKSRLVQVLDERIGGQPHTRLAYYGSPYHQNTAFYPVIENLQRRLRFEREDSLEEKLGKLEVGLAEAGGGTAEAMSQLAALLSLPMPGGSRRPTEPAPRLKQAILDALLAWWLEDAERQATLSVWEDLQWVDPSTLELLDLLIEEAPTAQLLLLLTFRPDFAHRWPPRSHLTHMSLHRLSRGHARVMVENVAKGTIMPAAVVQQMVARTDGVPLFVEELTKMVLESRLLPELSGAGVSVAAGPLPIPSTLQDSLMARLDRLGPGKEAVQLAATLGREFSYDLIQAVSPMDEASLRQELAQLVEAELLYRKGSPPRARYIFKHALIQDAAYQSLLPSRKREYHLRIARVLEDRLARETDPELLAHHYTEAEFKSDAIANWHRAGQRAMDRGATAEAIEHVSKGLALLETLPDTPGRSAQELALLLTLGAALLTIKDYTSPDVERVFARARELRPRLGGNPQLFAALFGLWRFHISRTELRQAQELGQECLALARQRNDRALLLQAHFARGVSALSLGQFAAALTDLERAIALCEPRQPAELAFLSGTDPPVACGCYAARALWFLGYPDRALASSQEALNLAHRLTPRTTLAYAVHLAAALHTYRREPRIVQQFAEMAIALASEHGFERWHGGGLMRRGWALAQQGAPEEGIAQMRQGLASWGSQLGRSHLLGLLAEAHGIAGQVDAGLLAVDEALVIAAEKSERHDEAELHRIRGELLLQAGRAGRDGGEAEACFRQAIDIARRQGAKTLELRAAASLGRFWQGRGKRLEAREMLGEIYTWFTEGFDTPDLREVKALLDGLQ